jgi:Cof subfamily protein (haloacid dehalogenase superfamily)
LLGLSTYSYFKKEIHYGNVNKISFISNEEHPFHTITNKFSKCFTIYRTNVPRFGKNSGEIAVKGVDKAQAVQFVLKQLNIPKHNTMAYGDGDNDIKMFEAVNYGVAMENATKNLKRIAKEITSRAEGDGIFLSFQRNQLISP